MCLTIHQNICIQFLKIEAISNSSVVQIGASGSIQAVSNAYNTGGYTEPAEEAEPLGAEEPIDGETEQEPSMIEMPVIPFTN